MLDSIHLRLKRGAEAEHFDASLYRRDIGQRQEKPLGRAEPCHIGWVSVGERLHRAQLVKSGHSGQEGLETVVRQQSVVYVDQSGSVDREQA